MSVRRPALVLARRAGRLVASRLVATRPGRQLRDRLPTPAEAVRFAGAVRDVVLHRVELLRAERGLPRRARAALMPAGHRPGPKSRPVAEPVGPDSTVAELRRLARDRDVPGRSKMNKAQLLDALQDGKRV